MHTLVVRGTYLYTEGSLKMNWSIETYRLDEVEHMFPLPCVVQVNEGYHSLTDAEGFSKGDILSIDREIVLHKVAANFVYDKSGSKTTNANYVSLVKNEILVPLNYKGRLKILTHMKIYDSLSELAQDFPRYAKLRETLTVRTEDDVYITIQAGTVVELDRIISKSKLEPEKLGMKFNHLNKTIVTGIPLTSKCKFQSEPDENQYTIKDVIGRFSLPQLVKFVDDEIRRVYTQDLMQGSVNMRIFKETMRLNRLFSQKVLVGHYKPVEESAMTGADGVRQRTLIVLPFDNKEIREIKVNVLKGATEDDYADIFMVRNMSKTDELLVDGSLYVDFAEVKPRIKRFVQREFEEIPPPLPPRTKKIETQTNMESRSVQLDIPVATRNQMHAMSASKKWSKIHTGKGKVTSFIWPGLQESPSLRSSPMDIDNDSIDSYDSGVDLTRLSDISTKDFMIEAIYTLEDHGDWLISSTGDKMQSYTQDNIPKEEDKQGNITKGTLYELEDYSERRDKSIPQATPELIEGTHLKEYYIDKLNPLHIGIARDNGSTYKRLDQPNPDYYADSNATLWHYSEERVKCLLQATPELVYKSHLKQHLGELKPFDVGIGARNNSSTDECVDDTNPDCRADFSDLYGDWHRCLALDNRKYAYKALQKNILPDQQLLNELTKHFGRKSNIISNICKRICSHIAAQESSIADVWPAVKVNCDNIIFVIIVKNSEINRTRHFGKTIQYSYIKRALGDVGCEGKDIINSSEFIEGLARLSPADYAVLQQSVNNINTDLMKHHKYLMMISISPVRSKGHETNFHKIEFEPCLVLYVLIKGFIPVKEEPFQTHYRDVPVDVREGMFKLFTGPASNYHEHLKSGCQIVNYNIGTLGGFVDYPGWGTCGLTCAHVVLNPMEMKHLAPKRDNDMDLEVAPTGQTVYQPDSSRETNAVGKVVKAIYREGGGGESGIDIAVFHILQRHPVFGDFPDFKDGRSTSISYDSGKTADISRLGFSDVYKFGSMTDLTSGSVVMDDATLSVRTYETYIVSNDYDVKLHNLIEIRPKIDTSRFAEQGDSGALVFCEGENKELVCVGVVEGGTSNNTCVVIPISPILEQLNLMSLKSFEINRMEQKIKYLFDTRITQSELAIKTRMIQMEQLVQQESARTVTEVRNLLQNFMLQMTQSSQPNK